MTNIEPIDNKVLGTVSDHLFDGVAAIIDNAKKYDILECGQVH